MTGSEFYEKVTMLAKDGGTPLEVRLLNGTHGNLLLRVLHDEIVSVEHLKLMMTLFGKPGILCAQYADGEFGCVNLDVKDTLECCDMPVRDVRAENGKLIVDLGVLD